MKRRAYLLTISVLLLTIGIVRGAAPEAERQMQRANEAYQAGDFAEAKRQYVALAEQGYQSEALYYNLANSYFRLDSLGKAVLYYERALLLDPGDADIQHNLEIVREQLPDEIDALPAFFLAKWWRNTSLAMSKSGWSTLALIAIWLGIGGLAIWLLGRERKFKKIGFVTGLILLVLGGVFFALAGSRVQLEDNSRRAVVMQTAVAMHSAPDEASEALMELHEGTTLRLLDQIGEWYKVELMDGNQGWLPKPAVEEI